MEVSPNTGHRIIAQLEDEYRVTVITQNVDDLHERAGSSDVLHLHGSLLEARSTSNENLVYPLSGWEMKWGEVCAEGSPLRPNIVWFNEDVPNIEPAARLCAGADAFPWRTGSFISKCKRTLTASERGPCERVFRSRSSPFLRSARPC
jgi:NAD-dependent deacetylase